MSCPALTVPFTLHMCRCSALSLPLPLSPLLALSWAEQRRMEVRREILGLEKGQEWGTRLAQRMMETERKRPRQQEAEGVR